jgi:NADPH2:quinone reductase
MEGEMRAWLTRRLGAPEDVLEPATVPIPEPADDEILIEVEAVALNLPDVLLCRGTYHERAELPFTPGCEVVGMVVAGRGDHAPGARVVAMPRLPHGGLADYCVAPARDAFAVPTTMPAADAAALSVAYQTAWLGLHRRARIEPGQTVLVHGAAGGVGSASIQVARAAGAEVIATARGSERLELLTRLGAGRAIDLDEGDMVAAVRAATAGRGADIVVDPVGGEIFEASRRCVAWEGLLLTVGFASGEIPTVPANHVLLKNYSVAGLNCGAYRRHDPAAMRAAHEALLRLYEEGAIAPLLYPLPAATEAPAALALLERGGVYGKLVLGGGSNSSIA